MALKRLNKEVALFAGGNGEVPAGISAAPISPDNLFNWKAFIEGPTGTPYEGHVFELSLNFDSSYPFKPPKLAFVTPVYHVNISEEGVCCLPILKENWSPAVNTARVLQAVSELLANPNPADPVRSDVAALYQENRAEHDRRARRAAEEHATRCQP